MPCLMECESLLEMGPPPDLIAGMPPPPIPAFLRDPVELLVASNGSCDLCGWAEGNDVQLIELPGKYPVIDDMWYLVIVSAAVGAVLFGVLIVIATLRCKEAKVKPVHDPCSKIEKVQCGSKVDPLPSPPHPMALPPGVQLGGSSNGPGTKTLWSGLKGSESSAYSLSHHPIEPELLSHYERVDYGSVGRSGPLSPVFRMPAPIPPPLPANPPPSICPSHRGAICTEKNGVRIIMGNGNAYYANPEMADGSFENGGYVDSECSGSVDEVRRVAPDGAVVGRRSSHRSASPALLVHGGGRGWEEAARRRFELPLRSRPAVFGVTCHEQATRRDSFKTIGMIPPPLTALGHHHHHVRVSSPLV